MLTVIRAATAELTLEIETEAGPVQRRFALREMSPARLMDYISVQIRARDAALDAIATHLRGDERMGPASEAMMASMEAVILHLLQRPCDDGPPATAGMVEQMTYGQRKAVVEAQDKLNSMEEVLGKSLDLLQLAMGRNAAAEIMAGSSSEQSSPEPTP